MKLFNQDDTEREMSGGAMFGYALIGFVIVVVVIFIIFAITQFVGGKKDNTTTNEVQIEQTVDTEESTDIVD